MDRTMLPDSLGDDHQKITKYNQLDSLGKTFCASKNSQRHNEHYPKRGK